VIYFPYLFPFLACGPGPLPLSRVAATPTSANTPDIRPLPLSGTFAIIVFARMAMTPGEARKEGKGESPFFIRIWDCVEDASFMEAEIEQTN